MSDGPVAKPVRLRNARPIPARIGQYTIEKKIGQGGAGVVYLGDDEMLGRTVAIKVLHKSVVRDPKNVERFKREARVMARISSPYVASVYGIGEHEGLPYMVMEFLSGENLEQRMKKVRKIPIVEALGYVRDAALGLEAASEAGVIHRDIKPANIVVEGARAKITDFGVARPTDGSAQVTMAGQIAGTAAFMSPERIRGETEDLRSDIYSLGATLYTLITGRPPFVKASPLEVLTAHLDEEPPAIARSVPDADLELETLVKRMMQKDQTQRIQSYAELVAEIHHVLEGLEGGAELTGRFVPPPTSQLVAPAATGSGFASSNDAMAQQMSGVMGTLKQMSVIEIVQLMDIGKKTAVVELTPTGGKTGSLGFAAGRLVYATHDRLSGDEAFYFLTTVKEGAFQIKYGAAAPAQNITSDGTFLMIEALRRQDEAGREMESTSPHQSAPRPDVTEPDQAPAPDVTSPGPQQSAGDPMKTQWAAPPIDSSDALPTSPSGPVIKPPGFDDAPRTDVVDRKRRPAPVSLEGGGEFDEATMMPPAARLQVVGGNLYQRLLARVDQELAFIKARLKKTDPAAARASGTFVQPSPPWLLLGAAGAVLLLFVVVLVLALSGGDEFSIRDARKRIESGNAAAVLAQVESIPVVERTPTMELARGHALAALGQTEPALTAYRAAVKGGVVDDIALEFMVKRLELPNPGPAIDALIEWPDVAWKDRIVDLAESQDWALRQHALTVLTERGATDLVDLEVMAILDLKEGPSCEDRRRALKLLSEVGKTDAARKAVLEARDRGRDNACMRAEFKKMLGK